MTATEEIKDLFNQAQCTGSVFGVSLTTETSLNLDSEILQTPASIYKVPLVLALFYLGNRGEINLSKRFKVMGGNIPMQACGISQFKHPVDIALEDLAYLCISLSDAESTDIILKEVGLDRFNKLLSDWGMSNTFVKGGIASLIDDHCKSLGFNCWDHLVEAANGKHGPQMQAIASGKSDDFYQSDIFNPDEDSRTTANDFGILLTKIYNKEIADPESCKSVLSLMTKQVNKSRIASGFDDQTIIAAKSGSLFRYIRNEVAIVKPPSDDAYAIAVFTRSNKREVDGKTIDSAIGKVASVVLKDLRKIT